MNKWHNFGDRTALWIAALFVGAGMFAALWFLDINQALVYNLALLTLIGLPVVTYFSAKIGGPVPLVLNYWCYLILLFYVAGPVMASNGIAGYLRPPGHFAPVSILYALSQAIFLIYCSTKRGNTVPQPQG